MFGCLLLLAVQASAYVKREPKPHTTPKVPKDLLDKKLPLTRLVRQAVPFPTKDSFLEKAAALLDVNIIYTFC